MASVTPLKRATGYAWRVQARDETGRMRQETFFSHNAQEAEHAARRFGELADRVGMSEAIRIRDARSDDDATDTFAEWVEEYLDENNGILTGIGQGQRERYKRMAADSLIPFFGEYPVDAITKEQVAQWVTEMEKRPGARGAERIAPKTIRNHHGLLSQILAASVDKGMRPDNPARGAKIRRARKAQKVFLTQSEYMTLLHFVPAAHKPLVNLLVGTGMRWGEVTALTWGDIERDGNPPLITIDKAWNDDREGGGRRIGPPKSEAGERTIGVPKALITALGKPGPGNELVFQTGAGTALWSGSFWARVWTPTLDQANDKEACKKVGLTPLGKRPGIHDLRHTHASWLIAAGRPLPYIQRRLGHEKVTTTVDVYGHLMPDATLGDADAVHKIMAGIPTGATPALES